MIASILYIFCPMMERKTHSTGRKLGTSDLTQVPKATAGFTLLELLMAVSILVIMLGVAYGALTQLMRVKVALDDSRDASFVANAVLSRLTRELQLAYSDAPLLQEDETDAATGPTVFFLGQDQRLESNRAADSVTFIAQEGGQYMPEGGSGSGLVQITYRLSKDPDQGAAPNSGYYLIREELPYIRPLKKALEKRLYFPVANNIESLNFKYYDKKKEDWSETWGSPPRQDRLPGMVGLTLKTRSARGKLSSFTTLVPVSRSE